MGPHVEREFTMFASKICMAGLRWYKHPFCLKADLIPLKLFNKGGKPAWNLLEPPETPGKCSKEDKSDHDYCTCPELCTCGVLPLATPAVGDSRWDCSLASHISPLHRWFSPWPSAPTYPWKRRRGFPSVLPWRACVINRHFTTGCGWASVWSSP